MSQLITTTDISTIRPVFSQGASENIKRYNQLKKLFEKSKEYEVFAEPIAAGGQNIAWHTNFFGKPIPFENLPQSEQENAKGRLKTQVNRLYKAVVNSAKGSEKSTKDLFELIDSCIEIPNYKDIYVIKNANGQSNFCIIRWGFTSDDFKAQSGLVEKLIPIKVDTFVIKAIVSDGSVATNEKIILNNNNETFEAITDSEGKIYLEDVDMLSQVIAYQKDEEGQKIYEHDYINDEKDEYLFQIGDIAPPMQNVIIKTTDNSGKPLANILLSVKYGDNIITKQTNENGEISFGEIEVNTEISCTQIIDKKEINTVNFSVSEGKELYSYQAQKPITSGQMNIKLVDEKGSSIVDSTVKLFYNGKEEEFKTDDKGNVSLENVDFDKDLKCQQIVDGIAKHQTVFNFKKEKTDYIMKGSLPKPIARYANVKIQAVNRKKEAISNLKIIVDTGKSTSNLITDKNGDIFLTQVNCNNEIIVKTEYQNKKTEKKFYCKEDSETHQIILGRRKGFFWLWLLPLILLLLALFYFFLLPIILADKKAPIIVIDTITEVDTTHVIDTIPNIPVIVDLNGINIIVLDKETNKPVENAKVVLEYNNQKVELRTGAGGSINFENVPEEKIEISVIINADDYTEQRATFMFTKEKTFYMSDQSVDVSEIEIPCGVTVDSKGYGSTIKTVRVNKASGKVRIIFDTFTIPDEVIVYNGKSSEITDDKIVWKSKGFVKRLHRENFIINSPDSLITIQINGGDEERTEWYFKVYCN